MYRHSVVRPPTSEEIAAISDKWNMKLTEEEITAVTEKITQSTQGYHRLLEIPEPTLPVKYPRTPGYRPTPDDNPLNAWYWKTDIQGAPEGKLHGRTIALKDNIALSGVPLMSGSKIMEGFVPDIDATIVTRLLDAGARITGKAVCEDMCWSGNSFTALTGPVLNPVNKEHSAGGSSCGSAALVGGGYVDMAIGCDQGGSIRVPSCWCGIVGLKPTHGLVPYTGIMSALPSVDHVGPMTKTVDDCALLLEVIAGYDKFDPRQSRAIVVPNYSELIKESMKGIKIGLLSEGFENCKEGVDTIVREAIDKLINTGVTDSVEEISIPMHRPEFRSPIGVAMLNEGSFEVMFNGGGFNYGSKGWVWTQQREHAARGVKTRMADLSLNVKLMACMGQYMKDNYDSYFVSKATNLTRVLTDAYDKVLEQFDVIMMPTVKFPAPKLPSTGLSVKDYLGECTSMFANTFAFDLTGHPVLTLNVGYSDTGLPIGVSIVGKHFDEATVLKVAKALETTVTKK